VNGTGQELFSGARFTLQQNGCLSRSYLGNHIQHECQRGAFTDDGASALQGTDFTSERSVFFTQSRQLAGLGYGDAKRLLAHRFGQVVDCTFAHEFDCVFDGSITSHYDDRYVVACLFQLLDEVQSAGLGHAVVGDDQITLNATDLLHRFRHTRGDDRFVSHRG